MAHEMSVQLAATGAFGTDDDFDLQIQLERDLASALAGRAECGRGEIEGGRMSIPLTDVADPTDALRAVKDVLAGLNVLHRATVVLETRCEADPDEMDREVLWPLRVAPTRVA